MEPTNSDVLIIGGGIAGLVAAYECLEKGLTVRLIDRDTKANLGGLAKQAFGGMALVDTPIQRRLGVRDSPELALKDWLSFANFSDKDYWPKKWAAHYVENSSSQIYHWLVSLGLRFLPVVNWVERGMQGDGNSLPRYHVIWGTGNRLVELFVHLLKTHSNAKNIEYVFNHKVDDILIESGSAIGCSAYNEHESNHQNYYAKNLIAACGGISGSLDKVRQYWYKPWGQAPKELLNGSHQFADGLIHDALAAKGVNLTHLDKMWNYAAGIPHPNPKFEDQGLSLIPCKSALWLDSTGKRIGPEPLVTGFDTNELCRRVSQQDKPYTWLVLNWRIAAKELAISGAEHNPSIRDRKLAKFTNEVLFGNQGLLKKLQKESDHFIVADNLPELVVRMNTLSGDNSVSLQQVSNEVNKYDDMVKRGKSQWNDDQLRRIEHARAWRSDKLRTCKPKPILDQRYGPLIAIKVRLISRKSLGGIQTNLQSRVLTESGEAIKGLYAVGEAAGFGGGGASGFRSLEGTFLSGCVLTARAAVKAIEVS
jgi:predicted oxidoreductase